MGPEGTTKETARMRWLVTGASGMLGQDVVALLASRGADVTAVDREVVDITDEAQVRDAVAGHGIVVNCAAYTAVDDAESHENDAFLINAVGPALLASAATAVGARVVHVSTDYVFAGSAATPYAEGHPLRPVSAYGRTKAAGEWAVRAQADDHLIVRTAWLYGSLGPCFPKTIARVAAERGSVEVIDDQIGQPTWTRDLAALIMRLVDAHVPPGIYHGTSSGEVTWYGFARAVVEAAGMDPSIVRSTSSDRFARPAARPSYSVLSHSALTRVGVEAIGPWLDRWVEAAGSVLAPLTSPAGSAAVTATTHASDNAHC